MLGRFFKRNDQKPKIKPLRIAYHHVKNESKTLPNSVTTFKEQTKLIESTAEIILEKAQTHENFKNAHIKLTKINAGTNFIGFNKPIKLDNFIVVYPLEIRYDNSKWSNLRTKANASSIQICRLELLTDENCIEIIQDNKQFFLIKNTSLSVREWLPQAQQLATDNFMTSQSNNFGHSR